MTDRASWLTPDAYLRAFRADGDRLSQVVRDAGLDRPVPTCPGWTLLDLVRHCGDVYSHKLAALRLGRRPEVGEWALGEQLPPEQAVDRHDDVRRELAALLASSDPGADCWTWLLPEEHTVDFWHRRMAQEALVHRVDAEAAAGLGISPAAEGLAADGVHEVLDWFAGSVAAEPGADDGSAGTVLVDVGERAWLVHLPDGGHEVSPAGPASGADARISGEALAVDLDLWGRSPALDAVRSGRPPVEQGGDQQVLARLRSRLRLAAQ